MQKDAIRYLIGQYMNDGLTAQQQVELLQLLGQHEEKELIDVLREMMEAESAAATAGDADTMQASLQRVLAADKVVAPATPGKLVVMRRRWRWVAAAAAVLALVVTGYVWFGKKSAPAPVAATSNPYKNDVQPGGNKAILTLGNGQQIVLDSAANGMLAQEGNAAIMKDGAGIKYQSATGKKQLAIAFNTLSTPRGGEYKLDLPDGSKVWLNAASSIRYPTTFTGDKREVELNGEGYFEVAPNAAKPFHVKTGTQDIEVLGTHFNVNAYKDEETIKTTLLEGSVKVVSRKWPVAGGEKDSEEVILKPGEQASVSRQSQTSHFITVHSPDLDQVMAWKNGQFIFRDERIENIMKQISRWYDVEVEYAGKPNQEGFTATISRNVPVSKLLRYLELTTLVHFKIDGKKITVME
jgi:ferric-dicitrate binding protein FerR (iron transport regulator)